MSASNSNYMHYLQNWQRRLRSVHEAFWIYAFFVIILHVLLFVLWSQIKRYYMYHEVFTVDPNKDNIMLHVTTENINEDDKRKITQVTRLGKRDSKGKGALTKEKGLNYLSPFIDFNVGSQSRKSSNTSKPVKMKDLNKKMAKGEKILQSQSGHVLLSLLDWNAMSRQTNRSAFRRASRGRYKIPEHYRFNSNYALNISNDKRKFSFNTIKFPDYKYFQDMKRKIRDNWIRNMPAGGLYIHDLDSSFYPGLNRVVAFKSGVARIAFSLDRTGKVRDIRVMERHASPILTNSCYQAIVDSKNFGPLPKAIKGERLIVPFQFIYITD